MLRSSTFRTFLVAVALAGGSALSTTGCAGTSGRTSGGRPAASTEASGRRDEPLVVFFAEPKQSGAALWAANCNRCHNAPPPSTFRPDEWGMVLDHMRLRADLTGHEARAILGYLKGGG